VRKEMKAREDDLGQPNLAISMEPQAPTTTKVSKKISILELENSNETRPEFFAFTVKF